jgi:hypothetical protein
LSAKKLVALQMVKDSSPVSNTMAQPLNAA